jgi:hypothetical protein
MDQIKEEYAAKMKTIDNIFRTFEYSCFHITKDNYKSRDDLIYKLKELACDTKLIVNKAFYPEFFNITQTIVDLSVVLQHEQALIKKYKKLSISFNKIMESIYPFDGDIKAGLIIKNCCDLSLDLID